jgi:glutathione synthase/RimK-type ligase-like ATP-grasp enzyme
VKAAILVPEADYSADWRWAYDVEAQALVDSGADVTPIVWSEPFDASGFDLVLPLVAWGYHKHFDRWMAVLDRLEEQGARVRNPVPLLRWNSDKTYLAELYERKIPVVPTQVAQQLDEASLDAIRSHFGCPDLVVKPPVSASAYLTFRIGPGDSIPEPVRGRRMMVQPWLESITTTGEWSLLLFDGQLSHSLSKVPEPGDFRVQPEHGGIVERCDPPAGAEAVARAALAAAPAPALYARVDLVAGNCGTLQVIELELIEPALWLDQSHEAARRFADAVFSAASLPSEQPLANC